MYLHKLEINGFKSFAKKTTFEFDRGTTAVVGPNGSGKSNVAESIRWVMGEQSTKSLRSKKSTDVIFSGSDKASRLGMAEVSLFFDNSDGVAPLDFSEVVITRRIHRDGRGEYFINGKHSRLQDILLLLAQINLSSKTYSVISQGMVDMILTISPGERKDFFEEASGVKPLQIKKNEALRKLASAKENTKTIEIQLSEITPRLKSLTRQVKRLDERDEIEKKLRDLQYHYFGETFYSLVRSREELREKERILMTKVNQLDEQIKNQQKDMWDLTRESPHSDRFSFLQKEYQNILNEKTKLKERELEIRSLIIQSSKKQANTHIPSSVVKDFYRQFRDNINEIKKHLSEVVGITDPTVLKNWHDSHLGKIERVDRLFAPIKNLIESDAKENPKEERELDKISVDIRVLDDKLGDVQDKLKKLTDLEKEEKSRIWNTQNALQKTQSELNKINNEIGSIRVELARIETRTSDLEADVTEELGVEFLKKVHKWIPGDTDITHDPERVRREVHALKHQMEIVGGIDPNVRSEYEETKDRYDFLDGQLNDLVNSTNHLLKVVRELDEAIAKKFNESFKQINEHFQKFFKILFKGGRAELTLTHESVVDDDAETIDVGDGGDRSGKKEVVGVDIIAVPPGKKLSTITALSGGERALTSIALIAAIIANNPAPFVVLDEVDAALDEANSVRFSKIIDELSGKTQFVVITHNRATMEQAQILYGVTMGDDGISKILSLKLEDARNYTNR